MGRSSVKSRHALLAAAISICLTACGEVPTVNGSTKTAPEKPQRVVSLDYCADQYVLELLDREQILAVSPEATANFSFHKSRAVEIPQVRASAEDVLILNPDVVVLSYGGGPNAAAFFRSAGIQVVQMGWAGDIGGVKRVMRDIASALGEDAKAEAVLADMQARLDRVQADLAKTTAQSLLYATPGGITTGPGSLVHMIIDLAGYQNYVADPGWRSLPLEKLAYSQPDRVATSFFGARIENADLWSAARHPLISDRLSDKAAIKLDSAWSACGGWFLVNAVEALAAAHYREEDDPRVR